MKSFEIDNRGVDRFSAAMKDKLHISSLRGRSGWHDSEQCSIQDLKDMLLDHVLKGDPVDIGNFAMMIYNRKNPERIK